MQTFRNIVTKILVLPVKILLWRKRPEIIAITGSAGKTSCKEFLGQLLVPEYTVLVSSEGYNTEIGAPLALFQENTPTNVKSPFAWLRLILRVYYKAIFTKDFPAKVVVEMGADAPGDIRYLARLFRPQIGVVLTVLPVHLANFKDVEAIAAEKSELVKAIPQNGKVYLNYDNEVVRDMSKLSVAPVTFFGTTTSKEVTHPDKLKVDLDGLSFAIYENGAKYNFEAKLYGRHMIYSLLAALLVANEAGIPWKKLVSKVSFLKPFKGRMNVIEGIKGSKIIDDSYNANPKSTQEALTFLAAQKGRRIAMLGTMNELGDYEEEGHRLVGEAAVSSADYIYTVGVPAEKYLLPAAIKAGFKAQNTKAFDNSVEAGEYVAGMLRSGDVVLAKGSQNNVRMEQAVAKIMEHPEDKDEVLVRQSKFWNKV